MIETDAAWSVIACDAFKMYFTSSRKVVQATSITQFEAVPPADSRIFDERVT
jgi:hypothetical protein